MEKRIYIIRHCAAEGQPSEARLTSLGIKQSIKLSEFFEAKSINRIISSPFLRAIKTIEPISQRKNLSIEIDNRLSERILSTQDYPDWLEKLEKTFDDLDVKYEGGESSIEAMNRIVQLIEEVVCSDYLNTIIVTHGNLMSLLLKHFDHEFGFENWKNLSNPDVYLIRMKELHTSVKRIWKIS